MLVNSQLREREAFYDFLDDVLNISKVHHVNLWTNLIEQLQNETLVSIALDELSISPCLDRW